MKTPVTTRQAFARQRLLKLQVLRLTATHYPTLAAEAEYQSWLIDTPERSAA